MIWERTIDPEYQLTPEEAEAILAESPEHTRLVDFLAGGLDEADAQAMRERLRTDVAFREFAAPYIEAWQSIPVLEDTLTPAEREEAWQSFRHRVGLAAPERDADPGARPVSLTVRSFRLLMIGVVMLLLVAVPVAGWVGFRVWPILDRPVTTLSDAGSSSEHVTLGLTSEAVLEGGSRLYWVDRATGGRREMTLVSGKAFFTLDSAAGSVWALTTPGGRLTTAKAHVLVDARDPQVTFVRVDKGDVRLDAVGAPTPFAPITLGPGGRGVLVHGLPPRQANP